MKLIYVVDRDDKLKNNLTESFRGEKEVKVYQYLPDQFSEIADNMPDILVINEDTLEKKNENLIRILRKLKSDENASITPIVIVTSNLEEKHRLDLLKKNVELIVNISDNERLLYYSISNIMKLLNSNRTVSPLTGLPGNVQIQSEIKRRLQSGIKFAMLYADLDNFKAYNDTYGFSKGDEIIKFTARTLTKHVLDDNENENNFVGHIGGDDFIAIVEGDDYEEICQNIIVDFESNIDNYFTKEDYERGYMEAENRKGILEQFPLTALSIGVVEVTRSRFKNTLEIGEAGAQVKHLAKTIFGSTYVIDRRKNFSKNYNKADKK